jgi:hypothetical protein
VRAAAAAVTDNPALVFGVPAGSDAFPFDAVILDRRMWPSIPPWRGHGGVGDGLDRYWRRLGAEMRLLPGAERTVDVDVIIDPVDAIRNTLITEHWLDGDHRETVDRLAAVHSPDLVTIGAQRYAEELASPLAGAEAVYWLPDHAARAGWPAAEQAFGARSVEQLVRRLPRLEVSLTGQLRAALILGAIARRSVTRGLARVVVIEGAFELGPFDGDEPPEALDSPKLYTGDVLFLDQTRGAVELGHPLAMMLGPAALHMLSTEIPLKVGELADFIDRGWRVDHLLGAALNAKALKGATLTSPLVRRIEPTGDWLRW